MESVPQRPPADQPAGAGEAAFADALGVPFFVGDLTAATEHVVARAKSGAGGYGVLCNVHVLTTARQTPPLRDALDDAWTVFPDGAPVAWLLRRSGAPAACRIGGPDLMPAVLDRGRAAGLRHVLYGSTPDVLDALVRSLENDLPGVSIVGSIAPPLGAENEPEHLAAIAQARPHVLWVALGAPKQEQWMRRHAGSLPGVLMLGVGAAFDFHARTKRRAPVWMQRAGLEWAHRLASEPRRLLARYLTSNSRFVVAAARQLLSSRRS